MNAVIRKILWLFLLLPILLTTLKLHVWCMTLSNDSINSILLVETNGPNIINRSEASSSSSSEHGIQETIVVPKAIDAHKEAQRLYDEALREYGATTFRTIRHECDEWTQLGCQCSGSLEKIILSCRGLMNGFTFFSSNFPTRLIKL